MLSTCDLGHSPGTKSRSKRIPVRNIICGLLFVCLESVCSTGRFVETHVLSAMDTCSFLCQARIEVVDTACGTIYVGRQKNSKKFTSLCFCFYFF